MIREIVKDTDSMALYKIMRETLVYLTHLDYRDTEQKMTDKLATQVIIFVVQESLPVFQISNQFAESFH